MKHICGDVVTVDGSGEPVKVEFICQKPPGHADGENPTQHGGTVETREGGRATLLWEKAR